MIFIILKHLDLELTICLGSIRKETLSYNYLEK